MAKPPQKAAPKRKKANRTVLYWVVFLFCTLASFAGGFWFTYRNTQVAIKEPPAGPTAAPALAETAPPASESPSAEGAVAGTPAPVDPFATTPDTAASKAPKATTAPADPYAATGFESPAPSPTAAAAAGKVFRVQVGNYDTEQNAQAMVDELSAAGIKAMVVRDDAGTYHAQIGAYGRRERALSVADEVNAKGYSVTIRQ